jgi:hypothetical protein
MKRDQKGRDRERRRREELRDPRASTIAARTSQIQRNLIAGLMGLKVQ